MKLDIWSLGIIRKCMSVIGPLSSAKYIYFPS